MVTLELQNIYASVMMRRLVVLLLAFVTRLYAKGGGSSSGKNKAYFQSSGSCEFKQEKVKFGGANAGALFKFGGSYPAVFACQMDQVGGKWLKFAYSAGGSIFHRKDPITFYLGNSIQCSGDAKMQQSSFGSTQEIGKMTGSGDEVSLKAERIRTSDALSNPSASVACFIAFCERKFRNCQGDFTVEFYDNYAMANPIIPLVMGLGSVDLMMFVVLFFQIIAMTTMCCSFYFKYSGVYRKLYAKKADAKGKAKGEKKKGKENKGKAAKGKAKKGKKKK